MHLSQGGAYVRLYLEFGFSAAPATDPRHLPDIIADNYGFPLAYHDLDGKRYYAVQDWIRGVGQVEDPSKFWHDIKRRLKKAGVGTSALSRTLPYRASDGKTYKRDHADAEALYRITQRMDAQTGLRDQILAFLAKSGVVLDEMRIDPDQALEAAIQGYGRQGKTEEWIATRIQSKVVRLRFTAAFRKSMRREPQKWQYAVITDEMRLGLWKRTTAQLREQMNLKKNDNLRDSQSLLAVSYELLAENISAVELEQNENLEFDDSKRIVRRNSEDVGKHAGATGRRLGIDIATNRPLLKDKV